MMHKFVVLLNGELKTYSSFEDIPSSFDNLIEFRPHVPEGPHSDSDHEMINSWNEKLQQLIRRETK
jgi:hypothetical protein